MKLLFCLKCNDTLKLQYLVPRKCKCGESGGQYVNHNDAHLYGEHARSIGVDNRDLYRQYYMDPEERREKIDRKRYPFIRAWFQTPGSIQGEAVKFNQPWPEEEEK